MESREKIRERGLLITADAKISFFNGTIYFLVYSSRQINQLHMAGFAYGFTGTGRLSERRQGNCTDSATDNLAPPLCSILFAFSALSFLFLCLLIFLLLLSLPTKTAKFSAAITQPCSESGTCHSAWKEMQEMFFTAKSPTGANTSADNCSLTTKYPSQNELAFLRLGPICYLKQNWKVK